MRPTTDDPLPEALSPSRIEGIDFLRGCAVLGILAINITGFWGPSLATYSPDLPRPEAGATTWFAFAFVVFEGKMRALFSLLFGASMVLFVEAAERRGANPDAAHLRRLLWLAVFGYAHFALLWWGDILFPYALCGLFALVLRRVSPVGLVAIALPVYVLSHVIDGLLAIPGMLAEQRVLAGMGSAAEVTEQAQMMGRIALSMAEDTQVLNAGFLEALRLKLTLHALQPLTVTLGTLTETLPLMLTGMALLRGGFFTTWSRAALRRIAAAGIGLGGALTLAMLGWISPHGYPPRAMFAIIENLAAVPHLLMALGYAAGLLLLWPGLRGSVIGNALAAAGRCAFSNYLGTSLLMSALFCGWGLGLGPELPRAWLPAFVLLGWTAMLAWPRWWLARFGQGPLEALWRRLTFPRAAY